MDNNQRTSLTVNLLVGGTIVTIMLLANMLIKRYMPHVLQYLSLIILQQANQDLLRGGFSRPTGA